VTAVFARDSTGTAGSGKMGIKLNISSNINNISPQQSRMFIIQHFSCQELSSNQILK
jgi:hypothetical protein